MPVHKIMAALCLPLLGLLFLPGDAMPADDDANQAVVQMVVDLVSDADRDMRALGLQQVREEVPGEAATKKFAGLLPKLPPEAQAGLLEALGDRHDVAARPAILEMLNGKEEAVRAAAVRALGALGAAADVPLLAGKAATASGREKAAARQSLIALRGDDVNAAILGQMTGGEAAARAELLGVLAARNAKETLPAVLKCTEDSDSAVRLAALGALRFLADESSVADIVKALKASKDDAERRKAALSLLGVCSRGREACVGAIAAGLADADAASRVALLRGLARAGGGKAMEAVVARLSDDDESVRDEAVRMLAAWPDAAAAPHLLAIAKKGDNPRHQVLALRGLVRLAGPQGEKPADLELLAQAMNLAKRVEEKRLALGMLSGIATPQSLALVAPLVDDPATAEEASVAAVLIAEKAEGADKDKVRSALEKVLKQVKGQQVRERAQKVLGSL
jgi:HEAT repeat protein